MSELDSLLKLKIENKEIDSFFDCLSDILLKLSGGDLYTYPNFKKYFSSFMLCRYLSMRKNLMPFAEYFNKVQLILSPIDMYRLAYYSIPKQNNAFIKYIKKKEKKNKKENIIENNSYTKINIFEL